MILDRTRFLLTGFQFHHPSEHWTEGQQHVMEVHLVHQNCDNGMFTSLEAGITSRLPLSNVREFDPTSDQTSAPEGPAESQLEKVDRPALPTSNRIAAS